MMVHDFVFSLGKWKYFSIGFQFNEISHQRQQAICKKQALRI